MHRKILYTSAGVSMLIALVIFAAGGARGQASSQATRTDGQGGITVRATFANAAYFKEVPKDPLAGKVDLEREVVFVVSLDTHSGDLSGFDFVKNTLLRNDRGQQVAPVRWIATADGSHHRAGGLVFPKADSAGRVLAAQAKSLELVVRNLGGAAERVLRWTLPVE